MVCWCRWEGGGIRRCCLLAVLYLFSGIAGDPAWAQDDLLGGFDAPVRGYDELLNGFEDAGSAMDPETTAEGPDVDTVDPLVCLGGHLKAAASINFAHDSPDVGETDWRGLSRLKAQLLLELNVKPVADWRAFASGAADYDFAYGINGRSQYADAVLDDDEREVELREAYLQGRLSKQLDVKVGRQIVVWGTSDNIRVVDVINPLDLREPGVTDIEDLRLPVTLTRLDYYWGDFSLTGIAIHEVRFNKNPPDGSDFSPSATPPPVENDPDSDVANTQFAVALNGIFSGWDLGFYAADIYDENAHFKRSVSGSTVLESTHARIKMVGGSANLAWGNWLIKGEFAWLDGLEFTHLPHNTYCRLDVMAGLEYAGFDDTQLTLEIVDRHLFDHDDALKQDPDGCNADQIQWVARMDKDFLHDTLTLTVLISVYGEAFQDGAYQRLSTEYEIADAFTVNGGIVFYQSGHLPAFKDISDNDRLFLELKYSF
ncbi:SH3 type 3 domain protein (fragment) [Desulfosarcina cetonica]